MTGHGGTLGVEQAVAGLRVIVGVTGFPEHRHHWLLVVHLQDRIEVEIEPVLKAYHQPYDGMHLIGIPEHLPEPQQDRKLLEEVGHAVLGDTRPVYPPAGRVSELGRRKLLRAASQRQECVARRFMLAWLLPLPLILPYRGNPQALARVSGCTLAEIEERWRHLNP